jgi:ADP-ribose pyrophosphatase YjhB (NUDIX family)
MSAKVTSFVVSTIMSFSRKIYYNDKQLILSTDKEDYINGHPDAGHYVFFSGATPDSFNQAIQQLDRPGVNGVFIEDASADSLSEQLDAMYHTIDAGGGLVYNERGEILMIFRRGKWDLPKGKLDDGEDIVSCALREVKEETGLEQVILGDKICVTYHIYTQKGEQILKRSTWYKMQGTSADKLKPQKEEDILEARWVSKDDLPPISARSYALVREILAKAGYGKS